MALKANVIKHLDLSACVKFNGENGINVALIDSSEGEVCLFTARILRGHRCPLLCISLFISSDGCGMGR